MAQQTQAELYCSFVNNGGDVHEAQDTKFKTKWKEIDPWKANSERVIFFSDGSRAFLQNPQGYGGAPYARLVNQQDSKYGWYYA